MQRKNKPLITISTQNEDVLAIISHTAEKENIDLKLINSFDTEQLLDKTLKPTWFLENA